MKFDGGWEGFKLKVYQIIIHYTMYLLCKLTTVADSKLHREVTSPFDVCDTSAHEWADGPRVALIKV